MRGVVEMFDIARKQYIVRRSGDRVINFFYKENSGICLSVLDKNNLWQAPLTVIKDVMPDYSICLDGKDRIHILCQNREGGIVHMVSGDNNWNTGQILKSKNPAVYNKHLSILCTENTAYFFYTLRYSGKTLLSFQTQTSSGSPTDPMVIDYITEGTVPFRALDDSEGNIYLFYCSAGRKKPVIGFKVYNAAENTWGEFIPLTVPEQDSTLLSVVKGTNGVFNILRRRASSGKYELVFSKLDMAEGSVHNETAVVTSPNPQPFSSLVVSTERTVLYWIRDDIIMYRTSEDGVTWSKPEKVDVFGNRPFYCFTYLTNLSGELKGMSFNELPGNFTGGYRLAFLGDIIGMEKSGQNDGGRMASELEMLDKRVSDLERRLEELEQKQRQKKNRPVKSDTAVMNTTVENTEQDQPKTEFMECETETTSDNRPLMPGTGFSAITPEYLRSLKKLESRE